MPCSIQEKNLLAFIVVGKKKKVTEWSLNYDSVHNNGCYICSLPTIYFCTIHRTYLNFLINLD
jgi:hypothetical protein